jgi:alpha-mannosidase
MRHLLLYVVIAAVSCFECGGWRVLPAAAGAAPAPTLTLTVKDTIFFREDGGQLRQVLHATVAGNWDRKGTFQVDVGGQKSEIDAQNTPLDDNRYVIGIPPVTAEVLVSIELRTASGQTASASAKARPHRQWRIYVAMKTHYDLGYTEPIDEMLNRTSGPMLDKVYAFCDAAKNNSPGHRFVWAYPSWLIDHIRDRKDENGKAKFDEYIARGAITWHALPITLHSYFCGIEDISRSMYPSKELEQRYHTKPTWAKQTDVPGHTRILPQILARSGVRLLQIGANNGVRGVEVPLVFWWESPDGSRVLTQLTPGYGWGWDEGMLAKLENDPKYPYDAHLALYVTGDNEGPQNLIEVAQQAERLSKLYAYPRIQIGQIGDFADWMESHHKERIPVLRTELSDWWIHGIASQAQVTAQARWARDALTWSERFHAAGMLAGVLPAQAYPAGEFREAYIQSLLYSEHTWGIAGFKPEPKPKAADNLATNPAYEPMRKSWRLKGDFARRAAETAAKTLEDILQQIASAAAPADGGIVVFNPTAWPRTDVVRLAEGDFPQAGAFVPADGSAPPSPVQRIANERVFIASAVPGVGYRAYKPVVNAKPAEVLKARARSMESPRYRIKIREDGEIASIADAQTKLELLDPKAPFPFNQYVYEAYAKIGSAGWHETKFKGQGTGKVVPRTTQWSVESGPLCDRLVIEGKLDVPDFPVQVGEVERVVRTVTLWKQLDRIDCEVRLIGKKECAMIEAGHVAFPFSIPGFRFRMELLGAVTDPVADVLVKGNRDTFAVQRWVDVSGDNGGVTWATVDAPLVSVGDIRIFSWDANYVPSRAHIYSGVLNNGWSTNFQEFQGGDFVFRYSLRAHAGADPDARFGWETTAPLLARVPKPAQPSAARLASSAGFFEVSPANIVLVNAKRAEDGQGLVIRLFETAGRKAEARVKVGLKLPGNAAVVQLTEDAPAGGAKVLAIDKDTIISEIGPYEIQTIRVGP